MPFYNAPIIAQYTRADAIADGMLIDVSETACEAGFKIPVALTSAAWSAYVEVPAGVKCQDASGRLWDILSMAHLSARRTAAGLCVFTLYVRNHNRQRITRKDFVKLKMAIGPGDTAAPVITIMLPNED